MGKVFLPTVSGPYEISTTHHVFSNDCSEEAAHRALIALAAFDNDVTGRTEDGDVIPIFEMFKDVKKQRKLTNNAACVVATLDHWLTNDNYYVAANILDDVIDGKRYVSVMATHKD